MILYSVLGGVIGFIGGMVGLVLGVIRFPIILEAETSASITAGTNLSVSTLGAISSAINHYRQNNIDLKIFLIMAFSGAIGAFLGSFLTQLVSVVVLLSVIIIIVSYEAIDLMIKSGKLKVKKKHESKNMPYSATFDSMDKGNDLNKTGVGSNKNAKTKEIFKESVIGFGVGLLGGMVSLVLGSIRMPAMISILKLPTRIAIGTNLASSAVMGTVGVIGHLINNNIDFIILALMGPTAMLGAYMGSKFTNKINESNMKFVISIVLMVISVSMFFRVLGLLAI